MTSRCGRHVPTTSITAKRTAPQLFERILDSNLYINGRYILQPEIFDLLADQKSGAGNEIQLTDSMLRLATQQNFYGFHYQGQTFDCGSIPGFVAANIAYGLMHKDINNAVRAELEKMFGTAHVETPSIEADIKVGRRSSDVVSTSA